MQFKQKIQPSTKPLDSVGELLNPRPIRVGRHQRVEGPIKAPALGNLGEYLVGDPARRCDLAARATAGGRRVGATSARQSNIPLEGEDGTAISREGIRPAR